MHRHGGIDWPDARQCEICSLQDIISQTANKKDKRIAELVAEAAQWQESCGQNYVRATEAELRVEELERELDKRGALLRAVLMFYKAPPWTPRDAEVWTEHTGTEEATTKNLCDAIRRGIVGRVMSYSYITKGHENNQRALTAEERIDELERELEGWRVSETSQSLSPQLQEHIRADERERCAKLCDSVRELQGIADGASAAICAKAIRSLGEG